MEVTHGSRPRIALISATTAAIQPAMLGLGDEFPEAEVWNLLDDMLMPDVDAAGRLTPELAQRMERLIEHAVAGGAAGILLTCSMYGSVAKSAHASIPVMAPDEAAFAEITAGPWKSVLVVASMAAAMQDSVARLEEEISRSGASFRVSGTVATTAAERVKAGDIAGLAEALAEAVRSQPEQFEVVFLAQYSLSPATLELAKLLGLPVVSGPRSAAVSLRKALEP